MVKAELKDKIIWITIIGDLRYEHFLDAVEPIFKSGEEYIGFISDGRELKGFSPLDQNLCSNHHKTHNPEKPNAILMKDNPTLLLIAKIYIKFTKAKNSSIFTSEKEAIDWVKNYKHIDSII